MKTENNPESTAMVSGHDVADLLRKVIAGKTAIHLENSAHTWDRVYAGNIAFLVDGNLVVVFNDCDDLDYVDSVRMADGRSGEFDEWDDRGEDPIDLLDDSERRLLQEILRKAR